MKTAFVYLGGRYSRLRTVHLVENTQQSRRKPAFKRMRALGLRRKLPEGSGRKPRRAAVEAQHKYGVKLVRIAYPVA